MQNDNTVPWSSGVDADTEVEENGSCTTHLEELNDPTKLIESGEVPLSYVTLDLLGLLNGHLIKGAGIGGEAMFCLEAVHVVEAEVSN